MKYTVTLKSTLIIEAETPKEATDQINDALEDARKRNCGYIDDEIMANAVITKIKTEGSSDK